MHDFEVRVVSHEEAQNGVAEIWCGNELFAVTQLQEGEIVLRIDPRPEGGPVLVGARGLRLALEDARVKLEAG